MHDGMPCDQIQGQGHGALSSENCTFLCLSSPPFTMTAGK